MSGDTRQTFAGLAHWEIVLWYCLAVVSTAVFMAGVAMLVRKYRAGRGAFDPHDRAPLRERLWVIFSHAWIRRRDGVAGMAHAFVFYGFLVLLLGSTILAFQTDLTKPLLGWSFWHGAFYLGYSLALDVFGGLMTVGLAVLAVKRARHPPRLSYRRVADGFGARMRRRYEIGDWIFAGALLFLAVTGFLLEALRIAQNDPSFERWSPIGWTVAQGMRAIGISGRVATDAHLPLWWIHGLAALVFVSAIPFTKAVHMLTGAGSVVTRTRVPASLSPVV